MGVKHVFELVPPGLKKRMKEDRRKRWDEQQAKCIATAWAGLNDTSGKDSDSGKKKSTEDKEQEKKMKEEHQTRTELLKDLSAKYEDTGILSIW